MTNQAPSENPSCLGEPSVTASVTHSEVRPYCQPQSAKPRYRALTLSQDTYSGSNTSRASHRISHGEGAGMQTTLEQLQILRLLRAFWKIRDQAAREAIIKDAERARD